MAQLPLRWGGSILKLPGDTLMTKDNVRVYLDTLVHEYGGFIRMMSAQLEHLKTERIIQCVIEFREYVDQLPEDFFKDVLLKGCNYHLYQLPASIQRDKIFEHCHQSHSRIAGPWTWTISNTDEDGF